METMHRLKIWFRQWKPIHLCWLWEYWDEPIPRYLIGGGDAAPQYEGSRIANATRTFQADEDLDVVDWVPGEDICVSIAWGSVVGKKANAREFRIRWRNASDGGVFADLGNTGQLTYNGTTDLVNDNALTEVESGINATQTTYVPGVERAAANAYTYTNLATDEWTACQWQVGTANALNSKQYEFELYNITDDAQVAVAAAQITMEAAAPGGGTPLDFERGTYRGANRGTMRGVG
jgi:hypothetical protein